MPRTGSVDPAQEPELAMAPTVAVGEPVTARIVEVRTDIRDMGVVVTSDRPVLLIVAFPLPVDFARPPSAIHIPHRWRARPGAARERAVGAGEGWLNRDDVSLSCQAPRRMARPRCAATVCAAGTSLRCRLNPCFSPQP